MTQDEIIEMADRAFDESSVTDAEVIRFAELIVLEMCSLMEQCQDDCDTGDASETNWGYISQLQDWIDRFKRHFGVEE